MKGCDKMGSVNRGSFNLSKGSGMSKKNNSLYNQNASKFGNKNTNLKNAFRVPTIKSKTVEKKEEQ